MPQAEYRCRHGHSGVRPVSGGERALLSRELPLLRDDRVREPAARASGRLRGKVALITGGTSGIGRAGALCFVREGAKVAIMSPESEAGEALVEQIEREETGRALFVEGDVSRPDDVRRMIRAAEKRFGYLNVLWANAGIYSNGTALTTSHRLWNHLIAVNLTGSFNVAKYGILALIRAGGGSLFFTASEFGLVGTSNAVAYCASKGGVISMARALAVDYAPYRVRVNCLCPGPVRTPLLRASFEASPNPAAMEAAQVRPILLGRIGEPQEIAAAALFLASDDSSYMTGSILTVDGGVTCWYGY